MKNKNKSSYQRLKEENESLKRDIYNLIKNGDNVLGKTVMMRYKLSYEITDCMMFGDSMRVDDSFKGFTR